MGNLGDLLKQAGFEASESPPSPSPAPSKKGAAAGPSYGPKLVVRATRKGRGGKTVTVVSGVQAGHGALLKKLKGVLGTGGRVDELDLVIQGDQVDRLVDWLSRQPGTKKIVRG